MNLVMDYEPFMVNRMLISSCNETHKLFAQSLPTFKASKEERDAQYKKNETHIAPPPTEATHPSSSVPQDNNIKTSIGRALVEEGCETTILTTRETEADDFYWKTDSYENKIHLFKWCGNGRMLYGAMSKDSTDESPEMYMELHENGEVKAYLIDLNNIDLSQASRLEALALVQHMIYRDDFKDSTFVNDFQKETGDTYVSGDLGDVPGWWGLNAIVTELWGKSPFTDFDFKGPESLDEEIDFTRIVKSALTGEKSYGLSQSTSDAIGRYLDNLECNKTLSSSDKTRKMLELLQAVTEAHRDYEPSFQIKGTQKLAGILGTTVDVVNSWLNEGKGDTRSNGNTSTADDSGDAHPLSSALKKAFISNYNNAATRMNEQNWWNEIFEDESGRKHGDRI